MTKSSIEFQWLQRVLESFLKNHPLAWSSWTNALEKQPTPGSLENEDSKVEDAVKLQWNEVSLVSTWAVKDRYPWGSSL